MAVAADPRALFAYLCDASNLADYFSAMKSAHPVDQDAVHTGAEVDGAKQKDEARFAAADDARTIRWGSAGVHHYSGELAVQCAENGSQVTVRLHTDHVDRAKIDVGLRETLAQIKRTGRCLAVRCGDRVTRAGQTGPVSGVRPPTGAGPCVVTQGPAPGTASCCC